MEEVNVQLPSVNGITAIPSDIVGMAISDGSTLTWFKSNAGSCASGLYQVRGSYTSLASLSSASCVSLPSGYTANDIRELSRYRFNNATRMLTVYADGKYSIGTPTNLVAVSQATFSVPLAPLGFPSAHSRRGEDPGVYAA